jgi:hypothetical protein
MKTAPVSSRILKTDSAARLAKLRPVSPATSQFEKKKKKNCKKSNMEHWKIKNNKNYIWIETE